MTNWIIKHILEENPEQTKDWTLANYAVFYIVAFVPTLYIALTIVCGIALMKW